jgi:twitching motility protein PilT
MDINTLLGETLRMHASDLHLLVGAPPSVRVHGSIRALDYPVLEPMICDALVRGMLNDELATTLAKDWQLCFTYSPRDDQGVVLGHFRVSVHLREGAAEAAIRVTPSRARTVLELGIPPILAELVLRDSGLVLVTGPTGSGKTTTMNALVHHISMRSRRKIVTIEDPVEYRHPHGQSLIVQLEVGTDIRDFASALRHSLREDPDVICIGEMRDLETISTALTAAETGHLVLATLHTPSAIGTINRIIDVFPAAAQPQIRVQLAATLSAVISQRLLPKADGRGRVAACELLIANDAIRTHIREDKTHLTANVLATQRANGMQRLEDHLRYLLDNNLISRQIAAASANDIRIIADLL